MGYLPCLRLFSAPLEGERKEKEGERQRDGILARNQGLFAPWRSVWNLGKLGHRLKTVLLHTTLQSDLDAKNQPSILALRIFALIDSGSPPILYVQYGYCKVKF